MTVTVHQPVAGLNVGDTYTGPLEPWLVISGYATDGDTTNKVDVTDVPPALDPTLADNREAPGAPFTVLGEPLEVKDNAPEVKEKPAPPGRRNRVVGGTEDPEVTEQTAKLDGSVDPATLTEAPAEADAES